MAYRQINVRSPFYVEKTTSEPIIQLNLRVWRVGPILNRPTAATYVLEKESVDGKAIFEISELVRDYIEQGDSIYALNTVWVEAEVNDFTASPVTTETYLATEGYTIHTEAVQKTADAFVDSFVMLPTDMYGDYRLTGVEGETSMCQVMTNATNFTDWNFTINRADGTSDAAVSYTPVLVGSSNTIIQTLLLDDTVLSVDFDLNGRNSTLYHDIFQCNKYNAGSPSSNWGVKYFNGDLSRPVVLNYVNKHGAKNSFAFTLKHTEDITSTSESFKRNVVNYGSLSTINVEHASRKIVKASKQSFTINTDYINEYYVNQLEELILSEYVWASIPHVSSGLIPVTITDKKISKKNHLNDRLIQYTFSVELARDYINTIR
tara:strand:+ start:177 stop:1304 length:1128 start_codon:yes stop_codon:yes gene_type:complete